MAELLLQAAHVVSSVSAVFLAAIGGGVGACVYSLLRGEKRERLHVL